MPKATPTLFSHRGSAAWAIALKFELQKDFMYLDVSIRTNGIR